MRDISNMPTRKLRKRVKQAMLPANGSRRAMIKRYRTFIKESLAEGVSHHPERERKRGTGEHQPSIGDGRSRHWQQVQRIVQCKGLGDKGEMEWPVEEKHAEPKAQGHPVGEKTL